MPGSHQSMNAALAIAMLRHQKSIAVSEAAIKAAPLWAHWPARLQRLESGPLADLVPNAQIWLDGGHNPAAGDALGKHFHTRSKESPVGTEGVSKCSTRWSPDLYKKKLNSNYIVE